MKRKFLIQEINRVAIVLFSATIYSLGVIWFISPAGLYSSGVTGVGQIICKIFSLTVDVEIPLGVLTFILNIPLFVYGFKKVSLRFALYSLLSVLIQSILMMGWIPEYTFGVDPLKNQLLFALIGGLVTGFGNGISLRYGTSTGGMDIIGQALSIHKGIPIGTFTMALNCIIAFLGGGVLSNAWEISMYTFIRIIISSIVLDKLHTAYNYVRLDIISTHVNEISSRIMNELGRGITLISVEGAYTHEIKKDALIILTSYELARAKKICKEVDPNVFIVIAPVKGLVGKFMKKTIM